MDPSVSTFAGTSLMALKCCFFPGPRNRKTGGNKTRCATVFTGPRRPPCLVATDSVPSSPPWSRCPGPFAGPGEAGRDDRDDRNGDGASVVVGAQIGGGDRTRSQVMRFPPFSSATIELGGSPYLVGFC